LPEGWGPPDTVTVTVAPGWAEVVLTLKLGAAKAGEIPPIKVNTQAIPIH